MIFCFNRDIYFKPAFNVQLSNLGNYLYFVDPQNTDKYQKDRMWK